MEPAAVSVCHIGLGATYRLNSNVSLRGEWERFKAVGDIDLVSIGVAFTF
jgi:hypothetical protein